MFGAFILCGSNAAAPLFLSEKRMIWLKLHGLKILNVSVGSAGTEGTRTRILQSELHPYLCVDISGVEYFGKNRLSHSHDG